jgi:hypothetical protein
MELVDKVIAQQFYERTYAYVQNLQELKSGRKLSTDLQGAELLFKAQKRLRASAALVSSVTVTYYGHLKAQIPRAK